jgi:hypothetical protein
VRNGSGRTDSNNGLGNLIVGYNERGEVGTQTGSHNVVVGREHSFTSHGGILAGSRATATQPFSAYISGQTLNVNTVTVESNSSARTRIRGATIDVLAAGALTIKGSTVNIN